MTWCVFPDPLGAEQLLHFQIDPLTSSKSISSDPVVPNEMDLHVLFGLNSSAEAGKK